MHDLREFIVHAVAAVGVVRKGQARVTKARDRCCLSMAYL